MSPEQDSPKPKTTNTIASNLAAEVQFERLSADDASDIAELLNATWPTLYGKTGCIVFNEAYLEWLYGGPDSDLHYVQGFRVEGKLMAVEAALYRRLTDGENDWQGRIATHLAISPDLNLMMRLALAAKISEALQVDPQSDQLSIAFFEKAKGLVQSTKNIAKENENQNIREFVFRQAIVNTRKAQTVASSAEGITVRNAAETDMPQVQKLLKQTESSLYLNSSDDALWHHYSKAPGAVCLVAEKDGETVGFLATYVLDWVKDEQVTRNIVAEVILGEKPEYLAALLSRAQDQVVASGARGIVLDNASYLDDDVARDAGILPIPKEMVFVSRFAVDHAPIDKGFLIDVK